MWEYDRQKLDLAIKHGYIIEVIWESEYHKNEQCLLNTIKSHAGELNQNDPRQKSWSEDQCTDFPQ